jgi:hypothetical protein
MCSVSRKYKKLQKNNNINYKGLVATIQHSIRKYLSFQVLIIHLLLLESIESQHVAIFLNHTKDASDDFNGGKGG